VLEVTSCDVSIRHGLMITRDDVDWGGLWSASALIKCFDFLVIFHSSFEDNDFALFGA
jgi:hypothetical protein